VHDRWLIAGLWTVLIPAVITGVITLVVLSIRATLESRAAA
jgi:hypothetical protein